MDPLQNTPATPEPAPESNWARLLPRDAFQEIAFVLRGALPPPGLDDPEEMAWQDWARRDRAAMAAVAALLPENAAEGRLAARFVVTDAWSSDCLRLARERRSEPDLAFKCTAQAMSLMREGNRALGLLLKLQAARRVIAADAAASDRAAWVEQRVVGNMGEALGLDLAEPGDPAEPGAREGNSPPSPARAARDDRKEAAPAPMLEFRRNSPDGILQGEIGLETPARPWALPVRAAC